MGEILGLGLTHYPPLVGRDERMAAILESTLKSARVPEASKDPASWPAAMREEWAANRDAGAAREHRRRHRAALAEIRAALDDFAPDFVVVWGDDQYENFREDGVPPFCVFATARAASISLRRCSMPDSTWLTPTKCAMSADCRMPLSTR